MFHGRVQSLLELVLGKTSRFIPRASRAVPGHACLREYRPGDSEQCLELYKENEPGRFPAGFHPEFEQFLDCPDYLKLVFCIDDALIAVGGVTRLQSVFFHRAWLAFGMVRPKFHGHGIGTAMLMARLAALPRPSRPMEVMLSNVEVSKGFFERFGFARQGSMPTRTGGPFIDVMRARLDATGWDACQEQVSRLGIAPETFTPVPFSGTS